MSKIFISHKREDSQYAKEISEYLALQGIDYYLDILDPYLSGDGSELTGHLRENLNKCTHLLALLSESTQRSWWVPFEIGLATEKEYPISTYLLQTADKSIPDYLWNWPVLRSKTDLAYYSEMILKDRNTVRKESMQKGFFSTSPGYAEAFHRSLKSNLKQ